MHTGVLDQRQLEVVEPLAKAFHRSFFLVGGTAIALYLGHRRSIDFDLFTSTPLNKYRIKQRLNTLKFRQTPLFEDVDQLHILLHGVKVTFFHYPWIVNHHNVPGVLFPIPSLISLAAMKAFALGRRAKWKDYVDLYFLLKDHFTIEEISAECKTIFGDQYAEKLFRQQLAYHKDIDHSEQVDYLIDPVPEPEIKEFLTETAIRFL